LTVKKTFQRITEGPGIDGLKALKNRKIKVGILQGLGEHPKGDGETFAEIAFWNEFGTSRIPPRPFMRNTFREQREAYTKLVKLVIQRLVTFKETERSAATKMGLKVQSDIQRTITNLSTPPNAPSTVRKKRGKANPLIDSGKLRQAISFEVIDD